jgi:hypothetical protein
MNILTTTENTILTELESTIEHGLQTFVEVGNALMKIRDGRLYREQHDTFEDYCRVRWGMSKMHAYRLMDAAQVITNLESNQLVTLPANESQTRPLSQLTPQLQREVWPIVVDTAPNGNITARHVESVVDSFNYKRDTKSARPADIYTPQGYDACQTPAYAIDPLLAYLPEGLNIWEPAAGEGYLEGALYDSGFSVTPSDILTGQNFFEYEPEKWDCIITNPPFSIKYKFLERCYQLGKPFALLMPVETLGTESAAVLFNEFGIEVIFIRPRINFKMPNKGWDGGGAQFPVAWFTFGLKIGKQITFAKVVPDDKSNSD